MTPYICYWISIAGTAFNTFSILMCIKIYLGQAKRIRALEEGLRIQHLMLFDISDEDKNKIDA